MRARYVALLLKIILNLLMLFIFRQNYALSFELQLGLGELCIQLDNFLAFFGLGVSGAFNLI